MKIKTSDLEQALKHASKDDLKELSKSADAPQFVEVLDALLRDRGLSKNVVIQQTHLERGYAYQIMQGRKQGSKDKVMQLCLALNCSLEETNRLLTLSNNPKLYARDPRDFYLIFAVENHMNVMDTNTLLDKHGFLPL